MRRRKEEEEVDEEEEEDGEPKSQKRLKRLSEILLRLLGGLLGASWRPLGRLLGLLEAS